MAADAGYHEGAPWDGKKRWVCNDPLCGWSTLKEAKMKTHVTEYHEVQMEIVDTGLVDVQGNPITVEKPLNNRS